jgi:hypothetical protein
MSIAFLTYFYALNVVQRKCFSIRATEHCPSCGENRPDELFPTGLYMSNFFECFNVVFDFFVSLKSECFFVFLFQEVNLWKLMGEFSLHGITAPGRVFIISKISD